GARHHLLEHLRGEHLGGGVVAAAMIRVDQVACLIERMFPAMSEWELAALESLCEQHSVVGYATQCQHDPHGLKREQLGLEVSITAADFIRQGLVLWRQTFDRVGDACFP